MFTIGNTHYYTNTKLVDLTFVDVILRLQM